MSIAGRRASQGYDYQDIIAVHWLIQLLQNNELESVQLEVNALPNESEKVDVDDIVLTYRDKSINFIQAKKNQLKYENWTLDDVTLKGTKDKEGELIKIRKQLEKTSNSKATFYSRSPFGELQKLAEECNTLFGSYAIFVAQAPETVKSPLKKLAAIFERTEEQSYELVKRLEFGGYHSLDEWKSLNLQLLENKVTQVETALDILFSFIRPYKTGYGNKTEITRHDIEQTFQQRGLILSPKYEEAIILDEFKQASCIGRTYLRTIANKKIIRSEQQQIINLLEQDSNSILVTDKAGSGKTCLLLDLADYIEQSTNYELLFIKGDWFSGIESLNDLSTKGFPNDILGKCARLANFRKLVVIIDSLDVLALNREHNTLKVYLAFIAQLETIKNISVIAACRSFDLQYDPLLRNTEWTTQISIADFNFDNEVLPFLKLWNIDDARLNDDLKKLLCVPQYLRLFELIANKTSFEGINTAYELQETVINEVISNDSQLGELALQALQHMANYCVEHRSQDMPKLQFLTIANKTILQRLISQDILQDREDKIAFTHQTLLDALMIRFAISTGQSLSDFTLNFPPLPFIRPFVRSYFFYLRAHTPEQFTKQIKDFLTNDSIAYHLKRLVAESLAEIIPEQKDWTLLRWLFNNQPDLFRRFFWRTQHSTWFRFFSDNWFPLIANNSNHEIWLSEFIEKTKIWLNIFPEDITEYYINALQDNYGECKNIAFHISVTLTQFKHWNMKNIENLLCLLLNNNEDDDDLYSLGNLISQYVTTSNQGDELLWRYITKDIQLENKYNWAENLHCRPDDFHNKEFLQKRLFQSEKLLDLALSSLKEWNNFIYGDFLNESSWRMIHYARDMQHYDNISYLLDSIEETLKIHAKNNTIWWQKNEPKLRESEDKYLCYFLVLCYLENSFDNLQGIEIILQNAELFRYGNIEYILGELMQAIYQDINESVQEKNQKMIFNLYIDSYEGELNGDWITRVIYNYLIWIPIIYRTEKTQQFIEKWQHHFSFGLPKPTIYGSGGCVVSPISVSDLMKLSDTALIRFLKHYNNHCSRDNHSFDEFLVGGREQVSSTFENCCSRNPQKYLELLPLLIKEDLHLDYKIALFRGIASHLRYRFGNLNPNNDWQAVEPLPDGIILAKTLLFIAANYQPIWKNLHDISRILEACCEILIDQDSANSLTTLLFRLSNHENTDNNEDKKDLADAAINSVIGVAAESTIILFNRLLENAIEPPELLFYLLKRLTRDEVSSVSILRHLHYTPYKRPELGWQLFDDIFRDKQSYLWEYTHSCFYYQYYNNFDKVKPYLDRLLQEAPNEAGEVFGNISSLAYLSNYIIEDDLFSMLEKANSDNAWKGAIHVFTANIDKKEHYQSCELALLRVLSFKIIPKDALRQILFLFADHKNKQYLISQNLALSFIDSIQGGDRGLNYFFDWLAFISIREPEVSLEICEKLINKLNSLDTAYRIHDTKSLIRMLDNILKEADELNDVTLIRRAIALQDGFLELGLGGIDEFIDKY